MTKIIIPVVTGILMLSANAFAIDAKFVRNELYSSDMCQSDSKLLIQTFEVRGADLNSLVWASISKEWPGVNFPASNVHLEVIKYKDSQNRAVRTTCLKDKFNVSRSSRYKFIDTSTDETSDYIDVKEPALETKTGVPDLIKLGK
ncbi:hypothetical protein [uncultured Thiodictyon sp.]|uniref:hypothetical protein n=1 Tax=uncultured Thiodictyon sp. TaxID=1846217 RepID=UPI0025D1026E|nr:hypothetical protein [uncultured Thiodictyon sp.]